MPSLGTLWPCQKPTQFSTIPLQARKLCLDIRSIAMYKAEHDTETLDRYCYLQQAQRDRAWKELSKISSNITMLVSDACKASMKTHLEAGQDGLEGRQSCVCGWATFWCDDPEPQYRKTPR